VSKNDISDNRTSWSAKRTKKAILYEHIKKRLKILAEQPEIGKPLRNVLKGRRRVQICSFVLIYSIENNDNKITLISFEHHDDAYN
jgi:mRNA-degrading endonuclease RelE of RelBE toxin-antitoxin system